LQAVLPPPIKKLLDDKKRENSPQEAQEADPEQMKAQAAEQQAAQAQQMAQAAAMAEMQAKVEKAQADAEKAQQDARKAKAEADKAETEAQIAKATWANTHMENLRTIQLHDKDMDRGDEMHESKMEQMRQPKGESAPVQ
jgi:hypothetical protein